jgi:predicted nucleic acid-binding protein
MELKFLLDSNAVIDFLGAKYPAEGMNLVNGAVDDIPNISIISKIEVLSYKTSDEEYELLQSFCKDTLVIELNDDIVSKTIDLRIQYKLKTPDAIIAATALVYNMILITRNINDFGKVKGLMIINPYEL